MDITPFQSVIATAAFIILAMSLFYKWMRDFSRDLKSEMQQTRTELGQRIDDTRTELNQKIDDTRTELIQKIDDTRAEAREDNVTARAEAREGNTALREELRDLRASVEIRPQGLEADRAKAQAAYELLRGSAITVPTAPPDDDGD